MSNHTESFATLSADDLACVTGGAGHGHTHSHAHHAHAQASAPSGIGGFFDGLYKKLVFHFASDIAGPKLADKLYGGHATAGDKQRSKLAMQQFLAGGNKLPQGVPNLFG